jgi:glycosyltransferase involved in cell wall biosynthesis
MNNPKVSIILPTYNGEKYLKASIQSCLNQTYRNIELIIVDDCSSDATPDIVRWFSDPRIKYIRNQTNQRLPKSLNIGFAASTGDYLTWTSDDNEFLPHTIEELAGFLNEHKGIGFVYTDVIVRYLETGEQQLRKFSDINLEKENNIGACYLYTRKVYETVGEYDPRFEWVEDYDYWIRIAKKFQVRHYPKALYIYGDHVASLTSTRRYPIVMMRDILRYRHGYLSLPEFIETVRQFSVDVQNNISGRKDQMNAWQQVFRKAFGISFMFGIHYLLLFGFLLLRKGLNLLSKPFSSLVQQPLEAWHFKQMSAGLKPNPKRKNALCLIPNLVVGGSEKVLWDIAQGLNSHGWDFHLITNKKENNAWCQKFCAAFKNVVLLNEFALDDEYKKYLPEMVRKLNIDLIVNTNSTTGYRCLASLKSEFPNLKVMDILHLEHVGGAIEKYAWAAQFLDRRVCISHYLKNFMINAYRQNNISQSFDERLEVVHNGINEADPNKKTALKGKFKQAYGIPPEAKVITFIGRLAPEKKPFLFIDIARTLITRSPQHSWKFVMAGSGPFLGKVKTRIKECGLEKHFILPGMLEDVNGLLADTFLLLVVSQLEGIPLVIQEAFVMDVPVISTNVGAIHELIEDGTNGYLVGLDEKAVDGFADKILTMANDPKLFNLIVSRTSEHMFPEFSYKHMNERYQEIFNSLVPPSASKEEKPA